MEVARQALYDVPEGWEVGIILSIQAWSNWILGVYVADDDPNNKIPYFYDTSTQGNR